MKQLVVTAVILVSGCASFRTPLLFQNPFGNKPMFGNALLDVTAEAVQPAGATLEWDYLPSMIPSGCPDPAAPAPPECVVSRFMIWDGANWHDAGMVPGPTPNTFRFVFPDPYDDAKTQSMACNDTGTVSGAWDREDGCSVSGGRLFEIAPPVNPRFVP